MRAILALAAKDLVLLSRDRAGMLFLIVVPVLYAVFFGSMYGDDGDGGGAIDLVVVDEDGTEASEAMASSLAVSASLAVTRGDRTTAADAVRRGEHTAYVVIPTGFSEQRAGFFNGEPAELELGVDPARRAEAGMLTGILMQHAAEGIGEILTDAEVLRPQVQQMLDELDASQGMNPVRRLVFRQFFSELDTFLVDMNQPEAAEGSGGGSDFTFEPIRIVEAPVAPSDDGLRNAYEISFPQGMVWALMAVAMTFATSLVNERALGTLVRLRMAPLSVGHILAGKAVACFAAAIGTMVLLVVVGVVAFGISPRSWSLLAVALVCVAIMIVGVMMLLSTFGQTERTTSSVGWAVMMVMAMLGGGMIPVFFMPDWLVGLSHFSPIRWAVLAVEGPLWRGFGVGELATPCAILVGVGVGSFALGLRTFRARV